MLSALPDPLAENYFALNLTNKNPRNVLDAKATYHTSHFANSVHSNILSIHVFQLTPLVPQDELLAGDGTGLLVQPDNVWQTKCLVFNFFFYLNHHVLSWETKRRQ